MGYSIEWSGPAKQDLRDIKEYISRDSDFYAQNVIERIINAVESLTQFPHRLRVVPEYNRENIREIFVYNYRIIFLIVEKKSYILRFLQKSQIAILFHTDRLRKFIPFEFK